MGAGGMGVKGKECSGDAGPYEGTIWSFHGTRRRLPYGRAKRGNIDARIPDLLLCAGIVSIVPLPGRGAAQTPPVGG